VFPYPILNKEEISEFECLDRTLLRKFLNAPISTPTESLYLELGIMDIETTIKARRIKYLHYLCTRNETEMLSQFFKTQWKYPTNHKDWTELVKQDLVDFGLEIDLDFIKSKSNFAITNLVKRKSKEYAWKKMMEAKFGHSKMDNLWYPELKMQDYLKSNKFTILEVRTIFSFRTRMANFGENFKNGRKQVPCPLCQSHLDSRSMAFKCPKLKEEVEIKGKYEDLYKDNIPKDLVKTIMDISEFRRNHLEEKSLQ
jgi:hypothetical protein